MRITNHVRMGCITVVFFAGAVGVLPATVLADEIWLEPAKQDANSKVGNWATAKLGLLLNTTILQSAGVVHSQDRWNWL